MSLLISGLLKNQTSHKAVKMAHGPRGAGAVAGLALPLPTIPVRGLAGTPSTCGRNHFSLHVWCMALGVHVHRLGVQDASAGVL